MFKRIALCTAVAAAAMSLMSVSFTASATSPGGRHAAPEPLYTDPVYNGSTDPMVCYNPCTRTYFMYYTGRRSNVPGLGGIESVHGSPIGIAESADGGVTWKYIGNAIIDYAPDENPTYWAPEVIYHEDRFHMFLTYVPGVFSDWDHPRDIVHLTSFDGVSWHTESVLDLAVRKVIDACVSRLPDGTWRLWYNNEPDGKTIFYADSPDLYNWTDKGKVTSIETTGEGPNVFTLNGRNYMIVDEWKGLSVFTSDDFTEWTKQKGDYLVSGLNGQRRGNHADVEVVDGHAYMFYFSGIPTENGRGGSAVYVTELKTDRKGRLLCDTSKPCMIDLMADKPEMEYGTPIADIALSDPFIFPDVTDSTYYMYGTGGGGRVMGRASKDLEHWSEPFTVMDFPFYHWANPHAASWASEVHLYKGRYYLFTTSHSSSPMVSIPGRGDIPHRATQIYVADSPRGPFREFTDLTGDWPAQTPWGWAALDGTLYVEDGVPYMVFCHEWLQTVDGTMDYVRLPEDLGVPSERPHLLFKASDAKWTGEMLELGNKTDGLDIGGRVTDGPWLFRTGTGRLGMLWSSWYKGRKDAYAIGAAYSESGTLDGPWVQDDEPLFSDNSGHGMLFNTFDGRTKLCMHHADSSERHPVRRPVMADVDLSGDKIKVRPGGIKVQPVGIKVEPGRIKVEPGGEELKDVRSHRFDSAKETDFHEFTLDDLGMRYGDNWEGYKYLVLEVRSSTAQRFLLGIDTDNGLHEKRTHVLPEAWVKLCIPLEYYREKPQPGTDLAATVNKPLNGVGFMHIEGGTVGPLTGVKGLTVKYYTPLDNPLVEIRSARLTNDYETPSYMEERPYVDEFGQWAYEDFEGKVHSEEELKKVWEEEERSLEADALPRSKYGGFLERNVGGTGFFRVQKVDGRWWFVDPDGYLFLSVSGGGPDAGGGGGASGREGLEHMFAAYPPEVGTPRGGKRMMSFGEWNLHRRYGMDEGWHDRWADLTAKRMSSWGLNTGSPRPSSFPYLGHLRLRIESVYGIQDVYADGFEEEVAESLSYLKDSSKDPYLIGYFLQNEPSWLETEPRVCQLILDDPLDRPIKRRLAAYLEENGDNDSTRTRFIHDTYRIWIGTLSSCVRRFDPNHLILGVRFGHSSVPHDDILRIIKDYCEVYAFNTYRLSPNKAYLDEVSAKTDMPMINGEFHFGTIDRGMAPGLVQVADQQERAVAFRYFAENGFSHPALVGIAWFQYTDQGLLGRSDGERYNIGIVDVTDIPYPIVKGIREASENLYEVHSGRRAPYSRKPAGLQGNEDDLVSKSNQ